MDGEGAVIGKAVERAAPGQRERAGEQPVGPLVEESAGLLPVPGRGRGSARRLRAPRSSGGTLPRASVTVPSSPSRRRTGASFRSRMPSGDCARRAPPTIGSRMVSRPAERIWTTSQRSYRSTTSEGIASPSPWTRRYAVGVDTGAPSRTRREALAPPGGIHWAIGPLQQAQPDLGRGRVERLPDEPAARIVHRHEPRRRVGPATSLR